jgi:hypothetical protein
MSTGEEDLFGRWSRRKQAVRRLEAEAEAEAAEEAATKTEADPQVAEPSAAERVEPAAPPPSLDDLTAASDLSAFLREGVPTAVKNAAMRKMWSLDPAIRDHVGLAENAWDFNMPNAVRGFGPLEAGRAVVDFLSAVGREAPADPEAAPATADAPVVVAEEVPPDQPPEPLDVPEAPTAGAIAAIQPAGASVSGDSSPEPSRPRHGGAVPR